jgi:hypothetical protein
MGGNASDTLGHVAGYGLGALSALTSIKGGGLQNWLLNRQRAVEDPSIRASLVGSPVASGMLFQSGGDVAPPGTMPAAGSVAAPDDIRWLQQQAPARRFIPDLPPLPAEQQVQTRAAQGIVSGLQSSDPLVRAQAKVAGKVPLTGEEQDAIVGRGRQLQGGLGPGGTVGIETPGMPITIGSPYSVSPGVAPEEFATYGEAAAAASQRGTGWTVQQTNRGTWKPVQITPPAAPAAPAPYNPNAPAAPPSPAAPAPYNPNAPAPRGAAPTAPRPPLAAAAAPPLFAGLSQTSGGPPATIPTRTNNPGDIMDGPFARSQPGYVGPGPAKRDGGNVAVFDSPDSGYNAMGNLLRGKGYAGLTLGDAASKWSGGGYGADWVAKQGFDPSRPVNSLTPDEMTNFTGRMGRREGYHGPPASGAPPGTAPVRVATPAPPPRPAPRPVAPTGTPGLQAGRPQVALAPPPAPYMGAPLDPNAPAPGAVPARVGYPSPAFGAEGQPAAALPPPSTVPEYAPPPSAQMPGGPPVPPTSTPPQRAPTAVEPTTAGTAAMPLRSISKRGADGTEYTYTYGEPSEFERQMREAGIKSFDTASDAQLQDLRAIQQRDSIQRQWTTEEVTRLARPASPGEANGTQNMASLHDALRKFYYDFPTPADRDKYVGYLARPISEWMSYLRTDPTFELFVTDLSPFQNFDPAKEGFDQREQSQLGGTAPTGHERSFYGFEQHLFDFDQLLSHNYGMRLDLQRMPVGQETAAWAQQQSDNFMREFIERRNNPAVRAAMGLPPLQNRAQSQAAPPPATTPPPPPSTPPASAQAPIVYYGHTFDQP